jgi:hypothetical protein
MVKNQFGDGLVYVGDEDEFSVYEMFMRDRVVMRVSVRNTDLAIRVNRPDTGAGFELKTHAHTALHSYQVGPEPVDVEVREHVDSAHLQYVIYGKLPWLLADLYVPMTTAEYPE